MRRTSSPAAVLADRLCRPQRIGVFGHRGVGKTTLVTMLYRESVGGRLPGLRLAAADGRTSNYLTDKILQLESGKPLPATLAETDLRFNLHHGTGRIELLMKDYQGEHVEVGRVEPIGDFLRDCDAVWFCLDAATVFASAERLRRQQEVEHLVEQFLAVDPDRILVTAGKAEGRSVGRPVAMLLTKADLLGNDAGDLNALVAKHFDMVRHALQTHCPQNALFAVSSLGASLKAENDAPKMGLNPRNLVDPLRWLALTLQAHDEARLEKLWQIAPNEIRLLERCTAVFAHRYPDSPAKTSFVRRLAERRRKRRQVLTAAGLAAGLALAAGAMIYDWLGYQSAVGFEKAHANQPAAVLASWNSYQFWHPTRHLFDSAAREKETAHIAVLRQQVRQQEWETELAELRLLAVDPLADRDGVRQRFLKFHQTFPEVVIEGDLQQLAQTITDAYDQERAEKAERALADLDAAEKLGDLESMVALSVRYLKDHARTPQESQVRTRLEGYLKRMDERDFEEARTYTVRAPFHFQTRKEKYQRYLDKHPDGTHAAEARQEAAKVEDDWDKHDFRQIRSLFVNTPGDVNELARRSDLYLKVHPKGRYLDAARELLRWTERVGTTTEYKVILRSGEFDPKLAHFFSRGMDLSAEIEVNGVRHGPSPIIVNQSTANWDYEFPRTIKWKLGDVVKIRVTDHDWKPRTVLEWVSAEGDPLAIRMLYGENWLGNNVIRFESGFTMPVLPNLE